MPKLPSVSATDVVRALQRAGFRLDRQWGSHLQLVKGSRRVTVPMHGKDVKPGTLRSILKQAGLAADDFADLLK